MANIVQFLVDDTSPSISYSPFGDTLSLPDRSAGWNPFFSESGFADAQGARGNGTSLHVTSHDGAKLLISWEGTTIQVHGNVTDANYSVELDGQEMDNDQRDLQQNVLATFQNLENGPHSVSITARIPSENRTDSSLVVFDQAILASRPPNLVASTPDNVYINSPINSQSIAFSGRWSFASEGDTNRHLSQSPGDRATIRFRGTAFLLRGTTSPISGRYSVSLNNRTTTLSARSSFLAHDSLLFYATALDPNATHTITIANEGDGQLALAEDGMRAFAVGSPDPDTTAIPPANVQALSSLPKATIAALVLGAVLGCLLLCALVYMLCICLPRRRRDRKRMSWRQHVEHSRHSYTDPRSSKAGEAYPSVIDIAPRNGREITDIDIEPQYRGSPPKSGSGNGHYRDSVLSKVKGFWRWKKEVETFVNRESLGIDFAHSPESSNRAQENEKVVPQRRQPQDISETDSEPLSTTTRSLSSIAFRASRMVRKPFQWSKAYTAATGSTTNDHPQERSWSPSYQINLPFQPPLIRASNGNLGSEFYPAPPPSYAASVMSNVGNGTAVYSLPRSVGRESASLPVDSSPESRRQSDLLLAVPRQSYSGSDGADANTPPLALRNFSQEDRGSVHGRQSGDDDPRLLGIERHVLRSLSPRTSRANFSSPQAPPPKRKKVPDEGLSETRSAIVTLPPISSLQVPSPNTQARLSLAQNQHQARPLPPVPSSPTLPPNSTSASTAPSLDHGSGPLADSEATIRPLPIPAVPAAPPLPKQTPPSPPPVIFIPAASPVRATPPRHSNSPLAPRGGRPPPASSLRRQPSDLHQASHPRVSMLRFASDAEQRRAFRLTPPVSFIPFPSQRRPSLETSPSDQGHSNIHTRHSYIDFSSSDAASYLSRNPSTSASSQIDMRRYSTPPVLPLPLPEERSRWSSSNSGGEGAASSITSGIAVGRSRAGSEPSSKGGEQPSKKEDSSPNGSGSSGVKSRRSIPTQITIPSNDHFVQVYATGDTPLQAHPLNNNADSPVSDNNSPAISTGTAEFRYPSSDDNAPGPSGRQSGWFAARRQRRSILGQMSPFQAIPPSPPSSEPQQLYHHDDDDSDSVVGPLPTGLSSPNYIVQRVLGLNSPVPLTAPATDNTQNQLRAQLSAARAQSTSSILQTFHDNSSSSSHQPQQRSHARSRSASTLALLTASLASRFPTTRSQTGGQSQQPDSRDISATL